MIGLGILLAVLGAGCFAVGVTLQHQGVGLVRTGETLRAGSLGALVRIPRWWLGVGSSSVGAVLHAVALGVAPLTVVQPVGVLALGLTAIINARLSGLRLSRPAVLAIGASTGGVVVFLLLASGNVNTSVVPVGIDISAAAPVLLVIAALALLAARSNPSRPVRRDLSDTSLADPTRSEEPNGSSRVRGLALSTAAGVSYGFASLLLRAVAQEFQAGGISGAVIGTVIGLGLVMTMGGWFMQQSYAAGPPQLAVASVTVVDPIVAVLMGMFLLGEAAGLSWWVGAAELLAGAVAVGGVIALARAQVGRGQTVGTASTQSVSRVRGTHALAG